MVRNHVCTCVWILNHPIDTYESRRCSHSRAAAVHHQKSTHAGHGLGYYTAMAKHQDSPLAGRSHRHRADGGGGDGDEYWARTTLIVSVDTPHLWLINAGGGRGLRSVDDLELNFAEAEAVALADRVWIQSPVVARWMMLRNWTLPGGDDKTRILPRLLFSASTATREALQPPKKEHHTDEKAADRAGCVVTEVMFLIEGAGGGGLGQGVSAGGKGRDHGVMHPGAQKSQELGPARRHAHCSPRSARILALETPRRSAVQALV